MSHEVLRFFYWFPHCLIHIIVLAACFQKKLAALHCTGRQRVQKLHATAVAGRIQIVPVAASRMQLE